VAEQRVQRDLDLGIFSGVGSRAATIGDPLILRPTITDATVFMHVYTDVSGVRHWIVQRSVDFVTDYLSDTTNGIPKYYAEYDETQWILAPRPADTYSITGRAMVRPGRLSPTVTSTWISINMPDLLFKACKAEVEGFVKDDPRIATWREEYKSLLPNAKRDVMNLLVERYQLTPMEVPAQPVPQR
jgi:hypothetical protein